MHLFAGVGGGILADLILGHKPVVAVEWDEYSCSVLRERVADGWFDGMSVWEGDVQMFDPSEYEGRVDCIHAGFPCQDTSAAGHQAGIGEDTRSGLYREVLRIADEVRPAYLFLENVAAIVAGCNGEWLRTVTGDLASRGYDAVWICLSAAEVGAIHKRDRWWLLAYPMRLNRWGRKESKQSKRCSSGESAGDLCRNVSNTMCMGQSKQRKSEQSISSEKKKNGQTNNAQSGWWSIESNVGRVANGIPNRTHRLKGLGNAQVPLQAATAFKLLWQIKNERKNR